RVLPAHVYGNLLQHFTGSREHNIQLRELAVRKNLRVSENGIVDLTDGRLIVCRTEAEVYATLGLLEIPPEMRLGVGEIEAARDGTLPTVVDLAGLRGDFHMHTDWTDGADTLEAMIAAAAGRGYEYHSISDHVSGPGRGLDPARLREQRAAVRALGERHNIRTLCSAEVDIRADGTLDCDDAVLAELDMVVASVHAGHNQSRDEMTRRLIRACENRYVTIIGHPTGRNVETPFAGYEFDYDAVFAAAARTGTALEIDGQPSRLDLPSALARRAREFGVTFTCDSDAHSAAQLSQVEYAVGQARRAWITPAEVLNARSLAGVLAFAETKRSSVPI
ncbi:MAG: PHP domain-containing protein, partial [Candidatus Lustribacter sp.]